MENPEGDGENWRQDDPDEILTIETIKQLLQQQQPQIENHFSDQDIQLIFFRACYKGFLEIVRLLLNDERININKQEFGVTPLWIACKNRQMEVVRILLNDERINVNELMGSGETIFFLACKEGLFEVIELLLKENRVDVNKGNTFGATPFYIACQEGHHEVVKLLLRDERIDIHSEREGISPFFIACQNGKFEIVKLLLNDERIDINSGQDDDGPSSFEIACQCGHIDIVKLFLLSGKLLLDNLMEGYDAAKIYIFELQFNFETMEVVPSTNQHSDIVKLLQRYLGDSKPVLFEIKKEFGILDKISSEIFSLVVLLNDEYFQILNLSSGQIVEK